MIEAQIECVCVGGISLTDLGVSLVHGQVMYLEGSRARSSKDLQRAWRSRGVSIKYVERYQQRRVVVNHPVLHGPPSRVATPPSPEDPRRAITLVNPDDIAARVVAELSRPLQKMEQRIINRVVAEIQAGGITRSSQPNVAPSLGPSSDAPVFIPSKIGDELDANLEVQATTATDDVVLDAATALRVARKNQG